MKFSPLFHPGRPRHAKCGIHVALHVPFGVCHQMTGSAQRRGDRISDGWLRVLGRSFRLVGPVLVDYVARDVRLRIAERPLAHIAHAPRNVTMNDLAV